MQPSTEEGFGNGVSSPTSQSIASSWDPAHHPSSHPSSFPVSPTLTAQRANNHARPGHYTLHRSDNLEGFTRPPSSDAGNSSIAGPKVIDPAECPLLYNMIMGSLAEAVVEKRLGAAALPSRPPSSGSKTPSRAASRPVSMDRPRTSIEGSHSRLSLDRSVAHAMSSSSPSAEPSSAPATMSRQSSGLSQFGKSQKWNMSQPVSPSHHETPGNERHSHGSSQVRST